MKSRLNRAPADLAAEPIEGDSWLAVASGESTSVLDELSGRKVSRHAPHARTRRSHPGPKVALAAPAHKAHLLTTASTTAPRIITQHAAQPTTRQAKRTTPHLHWNAAHAAGGHAGHYDCSASDHYRDRREA